MIYWISDNAITNNNRQISRFALEKKSAELHFMDTLFHGLETLYFGVEVQYLMDNFMNKTVILQRVETQECVYQMISMIRINFGLDCDVVIGTISFSSMQQFLRTL